MAKSYGTICAVIYTSILLLLAAAFMHAMANVLMKNSRDKLAFIWWMLGVFCVLGSPLLFVLPPATSTGWWLVIASGLLEAVYFLTLSRAYSHGDLSLVYPVARGSAPLFVLLWASALLKERPTPMGLIGIFVVVVGLYLIHLPSFHDWKRPLQGFRTPAVQWALMTGFLISIYTAVDKKGVEYFPSWFYLYLILAVSWTALTLQWFHPARRAALLNEIGWDRRILLILAAAILGTAGYELVLTAMRLSPVSYVSPVREISVVLGAWIGVRYMGEAGGKLRIVASIFVAAGIIFIAVGG